MTMINVARQNENTAKTDILYIAFELSDGKWKLGFSDGEKKREITIEARDLGRLDEEIEKAKKKFKLSETARIVSCYEAGRDGFWLHRHLVAKGIESVVVDSSSIDVNRRTRRAKTDRLDVLKLLQQLIRYHNGERGVWSVVNVPSEEVEDARRLHRELERLKKEMTSHRNRIRSLLILYGIGIEGWKDFRGFLDKAQSPGGQLLPRDAKAEIVREYERMVYLKEQIISLEKEQVRRVESGETEAYKMINDLMKLCGIGITSAWVFVMEFFAWRNFTNRRQVGSLAGLTPTPYASGNSNREQGISKAGNYRVRALITEIAWCWLRYQPRSKLSQWFNRRFKEGGKRMRRIGIVGLSRKLLVEIWKFFKHGAIPEGAEVKAA